jgi:hypothetical protein
MTDDEIYFDFLTIQGAQRVVEEARTRELDGEEKEVPKLPEFKASRGAGPGKARSMAFTADEDEFREWFEQEVGPWTVE